jgi:glucan 1,3-beta-glucosidase
MFGLQDDFDWETPNHPPPHHSTSRRTATTVPVASRAGTTKPSRNPFIRGVNIGGWLLLERFITPYMFALTDCHVKGDFCWFPNQISAPSVDSQEHEYCDMFHCEFLLDKDKTGFIAVDEYTLASQFSQKALARQYLSYHYDNFVTKKDVETLKDVGVTHVRVPMPHWIMGDILEDEPWVDGQWLYFVRFVGWCREFGIEVWPDIHTAPGSQNGFDNSGQLLEDAPTCRHWGSSPENVKRSLNAVKDIAKAVVRDNLGDVVTGFGVLNEPFSDCDGAVVKQFYNDALKAVRNTMGTNTSVYIGDMFNASNWNNGWWTDEDEFTDTFLDSHYYHGTYMCLLRVLGLK